MQRYCNAGIWEDWKYPEAPPELTQFAFTNNYRRKPEPKLRPWEWSDVPVGALYKFDKLPDAIRLITSSAKQERMFWTTDAGVPFLTAFNHGYWKWPTEKETEWKPCGVSE